MLGAFSSDGLKQGVIHYEGNLRDKTDCGWRLSKRLLEGFEAFEGAEGFSGGVRRNLPKEGGEENSTVIILSVKGRARRR